MTNSTKKIKQYSLIVNLNWKERRVADGGNTFAGEGVEEC
jgi:hypothetical protein